MAERSTIVVRDRQVLIVHKETSGRSPNSSQTDLMCWRIDKLRQFIEHLCDSIASPLGGFEGQLAVESCLQEALCLR